MPSCFLHCLFFIFFIVGFLRRPAPMPPPSLLPPLPSSPPCPLHHCCCLPPCRCLRSSASSIPPGPGSLHNNIKSRVCHVHIPTLHPWYLKTLVLHADKMSAQPGIPRDGLPVPDLRPSPLALYVFLQLFRFFSLFWTGRCCSGSNSGYSQSPKFHSRTSPFHIPSSTGSSSIMPSCTAWL